MSHAHHHCTVGIVLSRGRYLHAAFQMPPLSLPRVYGALMLNAREGDPRRRAATEMFR